jgi:MFS family permease
MERKWWTLAAVAAGTSMLLLDVTVVNVALPGMQQDFGASLADLQWVVNAYALMLASQLLTAGSLADLVGRRRVFVEPARAGMAAGINSTFRQVGIATGVAALGALLATQLRDGVASGLAGTGLAPRAHELAERVSTGHAAEAIAASPPALRGTVARVATTAFADGLNSLLLIGAAVAFAAAVAALTLIRIGAAAAPGVPAAREDDAPAAAAA